MGYYHENAADERVDADPGNLENPILFDELQRLRDGTAVVCSAGNDATARPLYPAAFAPWHGEDTSRPRRSLVPLTSVGAENPNDSVALFSNTGPWVNCYAPGASLLSTMPPFQGGLLPAARTRAEGYVRESIDPDDFRSSRTPRATRGRLRTVERDVVASGHGRQGRGRHRRPADRQPALRRLSGARPSPGMGGRGPSQAARRQNGRVRMPPTSIRPAWQPWSRVVCPRRGACSGGRARGHGSGSGRADRRQSGVRDRGAGDLADAFELCDAALSRQESPQRRRASCTRSVP